MPELTHSVGDGGTNLPHEVALVKMMLKVVGRFKGVGYLHGDYTSPSYGDTGSAIVAFQKANSLAAGTTATNHRPDRSGVVEPGSQTWQLLVSQLPDAYKQARTLEGTTLAYFPMPAFVKGQSLNEIRLHELDAGFKDKLVSLVEKFYVKSGIVLFINPTGWRRTFDEQMGKVTEAAPGESIHQYGVAIDIGFKDLRYVAIDGAIRQTATSNRGFEELPRHKEPFFKARNKIAVEQLGLFATILGGDWFHLQAYDDARLDSVTSFMTLLESVGKRMSWGPHYMTPTDYWCDLGLGGERFLVGTAVEIWDRNKAIVLTKADLAKALTAKLTADPRFSVEQFLGVPLASTAHPGKPADKPDAITAASFSDHHLAAVKTLLRAEFAAAQAQWKKWRPIYYRSAARRGPNPRFPKKH
jgi:hypothetical protein